jgi:hypothetical protein
MRPLLWVGGDGVSCLRGRERPGAVVDRVSGCLIDGCDALYRCSEQHRMRSGHWIHAVPAFNVIGADVLGAGRWVVRRAEW